MIKTKESKHIVLLARNLNTKLMSIRILQVVIFTAHDAVVIANTNRLFIS